MRLWARAFHGSCAALAKRRATPALLPPGWEAVIGIECHAQLSGATKLFSATPPPALHTPPNTRVAPFDLALPGTMPQLQPGAVRAALKAALALRCTVAPHLVFDRKHYFYADLPAGYQITQKRTPFAHEGTIAIRFEDGYLSSPDDALDVPIVQLQLEQDTGKSTYVATDSAHLSLLDFNRAGVALIEIVSAPVLRTPEQAGAYVRKLRDLLRCVGASDGNMNEGSLRCDANVSVHRVGEPFGVRCEVKNLNSVKFMMQALTHEIQRQHAVLEAGDTVAQETRGFDEARGVTYTLRRKEESLDYRFMPEPNVPPLSVSPEDLDTLAASLPELPDARHARLREQYGLSVRDVNVLTRLNAEDDAAPAPPPGLAPRIGALHYTGNAVVYFEELVRLGVAAQVAVNWTIHVLPKHLGAARIAFCHVPVPPAAVAELVALMDEGYITPGTAQELLKEMVQTGRVPWDEGALRLREHVAMRGMQRLGRDALRPLCEATVAALPSEVAAVRAGKEKVLMRLVGDAMRRAAGRADAAEVTAVLRALVATT